MERSGLDLFFFLCVFGVNLYSSWPVLWYAMVSVCRMRLHTHGTHIYKHIHKCTQDKVFIKYRAKKGDRKIWWYLNACACIYVRLYVSHPTPLTPHPSYFDTHGVTRSFGARTHTHAVLFAALKIYQNSRITGMGSCPLFFCKIGQCVFYLAHTTNQQAKAPLR